ncbi:MAG: DUF1993 domain-containing protein [Bdellovibrionales bacterium]|nr:DUF1993 domain-containing protein [Bdellovibrionales bacterium]
MNHSVNDIVVNQYTRSLNALKGILGKARAFARERNFDENNLLQLRLAPDMFPLVRQVQIVSDGAKAAVAKLANKSMPSFPDEEKTMEELFVRIDKTIHFLKEFEKEEFKDYSQQKMSFPWNPGNYLMGEDYLVSHSLPNLYFHMSTVYSILRLHGVPLGKSDYLGNQNWKKD